MFLGGVALHFIAFWFGNQSLGLFASHHFCRFLGEVPVFPLCEYLHYFSPLGVEILNLLISKTSD